MDSFFAHTPALELNHFMEEAWRRASTSVIRKHIKSGREADYPEWLHDDWYVIRERRLGQVFRVILGEMPEDAALFLVVDDDQ